uniref:uncharacterized protein LOC122591588 n=1 Tax=Erigeron canadensis TaxID=72917 RepID=UPI001CB9347B|nr:uncharacterized protein LOC122591588 [Erigeron canadensis]
MPFDEGTLPVRYLGVPLISTKLVYKDCKILIEKMDKRIIDWRNKSLSFAGRLQLINYVLASLHVYWASVFIVPSRFIKDLEKRMRSFLWCQGPMVKGKAKVAWKDVCLPKYEGGLAIRKIKDVNESLMASHIWTWFDQWHPHCPLADFISQREVAKASFNQNSIVADLILHDRWIWPQAWYDMFPVLIHVQPPDLQQHKLDSLSWLDSSNNQVTFSSKSVWDTFRLRQVQVDWVHLVWFPQSIPRHAFHMWLIFNGKLKTHDKMRHWDVGSATNLNLLVCSLCKTGPDSLEHLFFECSYSEQIWCIIKRKVGMQHLPTKRRDIVDFLQPKATSKNTPNVARILGDWKLSMDLIQQGS